MVKLFILGSSQSRRQRHFFHHPNFGSRDYLPQVRREVTGTHSGGQVSVLLCLSALQGTIESARRGLLRVLFICRPFLRIFWHRVRLQYVVTKFLVTRIRSHHTSSAYLASPTGEGAALSFATTLATFRSLRMTRGVSANPTTERVMGYWFCLKNVHIRTIAHSRVLLVYLAFELSGDSAKSSVGCCPEISHDKYP